MPRKLLSLCITFLSLSLFATTPFRVAQLTDTHISRSNPKPLEDLRRSINDINALQAGELKVSMVLVTGDLTEAGDRQSMEQVKAELDKLLVPYYCCSGNHETTWSESGCTDFHHVFGSDRFAVMHDDIFFIGFNSGPVLKMADGHVAPQDLSWAKQQLDQLPKGTKVVAVTHYPMQEGDVDNWYEVTSLFREYNTQCFIGGHYHRNLLFNADGIPDVLNRSNLRGNAEVNGYSLITFGEEEITFAEKIIGEQPSEWLTIPLGDASLTRGEMLPRPSYDVNKQYKKVKEIWNTPIGVGIYSAPARNGKRVFVGDDYGTMHCLHYKNGKTLWTYQTGSRINSTPAIEKGRIVFGSTDGYVYCLSEADGKLLWRYNTGKPVMGCPVMKDDMVLIGGNGAFYALDLMSGALRWETPVAGYCVSRPCIYNDMVYFGAWGCFFYALQISDGKMAWKWSNGSSNDKFSPAAVWPVASNGKVFIVAPDRVFTCLNAETGETIYRTNEHMVRENIGMSADGKVVYSRCMRDSVQAMSALTDTPATIWKTSADYGYDHDPSMMLETDGVIIFGTKNGLMHGVDAKNGKVLWRHKIGNCVVNTICPISKKECLTTSSDGHVIRLKAK